MKVASPRHFTDENRCQPFVAELFVYAEEVNLRRMLRTFERGRSGGASVVNSPILTMLGYGG